MTRIGDESRSNRCARSAVLVLAASLLLVPAVFAAPGDLQSFTKISDTAGGFTGVVDDGDNFGAIVGSLGDLDGDGVEDVVATALMDDDGGTDRGAVWILFLKSDGTAKGHQKISDTAGGFTGTLDDGDQLGRSVTSLGDLDGDGVIDIAVGAFEDDDGGSGRGAVWILFLKTDGTVKGHQKISDTVGGFTGGLANGDKFGSSVTNIGDLDGDGVVDVAVGAVEGDDGGNNRGAVWILFLKADGTVKGHQKIASSTGGFTGTLDDDDLFGFSATGVGDLDGDGVEDLAVGAPVDGDGGPTRGAVWVLFLKTDGTVKSHQKISDTAGNFTGTLADVDALGSSLGNLGDLDNDGVIDLGVGAFMADDGGPNRGALWLLFMKSDGTVKSHQKISDTDGGFTATLDDDDQFGISSANLGDLDGDGGSEVAVGVLEDDDGGSNRGALYLLSFDGGNVAPVAVNDAYTTSSTSALVATKALTVAAGQGVLVNDTDGNGDALTAIKVTDPSDGTLSLSADGSFTYTPNSGFAGTDSFTYKANDGTVDSNVATVTITVSNTAPTANDDSHGTTAGTPLAVPAATGVLSNDSDAEGHSLTAIKVTDPSDGTLTLGADGSFTYTPNGGFAGTDTFTYKANDGIADSNIATVTITVSNTAPIANGDTYVTMVDISLTAPVGTGVLANDTDTEGHGLTAIKVTDPSDGTLSLSADGSFTYTPNSGFEGTDSFTYKANDGTADSNTATVTITVQANAAPVASDDAYTSSKTKGGRVVGTRGVDVPAATGVLANDTDTDGDTLTAIKVTDPSNGALSLASDGSFSYTANSGFEGDDTFTYKANDGQVDSNVATVTVTVQNTAPVANADAYTVVSYGTLNGTSVLGNDTDADGDALSAVLATDPTQNGSLTLAADGTFTYTPAGGFFGTDTFTYRATDGALRSNAATVSVEVEPCRFALPATSGTVSRDGGSLDVRLLTNGANCPWEATSNESWISISGVKASGTGPGTVSLAAEANPRGEDRSGTVTIAGLTYVVNQAAARCVFSTELVMQGYTAAGGETRFRVETLPGCGWEAASSESWVTLLGSSRTRTGSGPVRYRVAENEGSRRDAVISIAAGTRHRVLQLGADEGLRPEPPGQLAVEAISPTELRVTWDDRARDESGYRIVRTKPPSTDGSISILGANSESYDDDELTPNTRYCYKVQPFTTFFRGGAAKACATTPAAAGMAPTLSAETEGPRYVTEPYEVTVVAPGVEAPEALPLVRIYKNYEPWGGHGVETALENLGHVHGDSLYVHPMEDLVRIPRDTAVIVVPSPSDGNARDQVEAFNLPRAQQQLRRFVRRGGTLIVHDWGPDKGPYVNPLVPGVEGPQGSGYLEIRYRRGRMYLTGDAVDHPVAGVLRAWMYDLLERETVAPEARRTRREAVR